MKKSLSDRMAQYERVGGNDETFLPGLPVIVRLDGRSFGHQVTRCRKVNAEGIEKVFDPYIHYVFKKTLQALVFDYRPVIGFTGSDEITLVFDAPDVHSEFLFGGRKYKWISNIASSCTAHFNLQMAYLRSTMFDNYGHCMRDEEERHRLLSTFDCKIFQVPSRNEAVNALICRELSITRNAITKLARHYFSHRDIYSLNGKQIQEKLMQECQVNFNDLESWMKRGLYVQWKRLPADTYDLTYSRVTRVAERAVIISFDQPLHHVKNREACIFSGEMPVYFSSEEAETQPDTTLI